MKTLKAIISRTNNVVHVAFALSRGRPVRLAYPKDITDAEANLIRDAIVEQRGDGSTGQEVSDLTLEDVN